jgi:hypothetical protein
MAGGPDTPGSRSQAATQSAPQPAPRAAADSNAPPASARKIGHRSFHPASAQPSILNVT